MEKNKYCTYQHMLAQIWRSIFISRKFCLAGQAQPTQHYIAVASFTLEGKLLAEMWPRVFFIFFNFNWWKVWCFSLLVVRSLLVVLTIIFLPLSFVTRHRRLALTPSSTLCSIHHCNENCRARFPPFGFLSWTMFFFLLSNGCNFQCSEVQYFSQNLLK